ERRRGSSSDRAARSVNRPHRLNLGAAQRAVVLVSRTKFLEGPQKAQKAQKRFAWFLFVPFVPFVASPSVAVCRAAIAPSSTAIVRRRRQSPCCFSQASACGHCRECQRRRV